MVYVVSVEPKSNGLKSKTVSNQKNHNTHNITRTHIEIGYL